jgi:hypothetical protein
MVSTVTPLRKSQRPSQETDSSVAHALAVSGLPVYVASSRRGSILLLFVQDVFGPFLIRSRGCLTLIGPDCGRI